MSDEGTGSSVFVPVVPDASISLLPVLSEITLTQVSFTWSDGAYNGGKPILDYRVSYDQGTAVWVDLEEGITQKQYTATGLDQGLTYKFKVEARNEVGYSLPSVEIAILTAIIPEAPFDVATTVVANSIVVSW